ncbi:MFS family permease [Nocardioides ginsengisegetis]|uniref:MFS family permease n=1 Tax=Nocardioides ginsengisegetis TaxID=661491 RepID=A0A7W3P9U5_9ACTN|nr:MFS family permease [Nocardioides ginsengisegetis]
MLTSYRRVLTRPGTLLFSATGLVARLPISMVGLGIVLLISTATGSYGVAGAVSAAYMLTNAVLAILQGRMVDRLGQARVLSVAAAAFGVTMVLLVVSVRADWPTAASFLFAATAGGTLPQVGSCVRARWSHALDDPREVQTAFAIEAVADEVVFMVGPIVITVLATAWDPAAGLAVAVVACVGGTLAFCAQRATEPPAHPHHETSGPRPPMPWATVAPLTVVAASLGVLFGAAEVTTVAFSAEQGSPGWAGGLLALWALGSMVAGLLSGAVSWRRGPTIRVRWGAVGMLAAMVPLHFVGTIWLMGVVLLVGGFAIAPTLIASLSLTEGTVPSGRLTEGMAILQTGLVAGVAPGATVAGLVIDAHGASAAYLVCVAAGLVGALAAQTLPRDRPPT